MHLPGQLLSSVTNKIAERTTRVLVSRTGGKKMRIDGDCGKCEVISIAVGKRLFVSPSVLLVLFGLATALLTPRHTCSGRRSVIPS